MIFSPISFFIYFIVFFESSLIILMTPNSLQPNLVASHRLYLSKVDVTELSDTCSGRGDTLTLFLFNDVMEVSVIPCHFHFEGAMLVNCCGLFFFSFSFSSSSFFLFPLFFLLLLLLVLLFLIYDF